jgi:dipeptidyl aminopeptidase/acylaminoacyl peptidase
MSRFLSLGIICLLVILPAVVSAAEKLEPDAAVEGDLEEAVARMARIGSCWSPSFSPDGTQVAFVSDLSGVPQVWTVSSEGGWPRRVTALDDQVGGVTWSPDGKWLAFTLAPGGGMNQQVYLIRPDGDGLRRLTDGGKENNWLGDWNHSGTLLTLSSNREDPRSMDGYTYELSTGTLKLAARNSGIGRITDIDGDGQRAVAWRMKSRSDTNLWLVDVDSGEEVLLTPHEPPGTFSGGHFSPDGKTVYLSSNKDRDRTALARVRIGEDGKPGPIEIIAARDDAELEDFEVTSDGKVAAVIWNASGRNDLAFLDLASAAMVREVELPAEIAGGMAFSRDGTALALTVSGATAPQDLWIVNRSTGKSRQITHSPHPGVDLESLVRPELVVFEAHDGEELSGWLYRPRDAEEPGPVVITFHGGPEGQARPNFRSDIQALLARGLGVFAPNVRGSSGFGKRFVNLDNGALRFDGIKDIRACVEHIVSTGVADPARIGIMGGSYGGYMTMIGLAEYPDLFAAGANVCGVVNFETFFANTEPWMAAISTVEYGDPETQADLLRKLSPIHKVDQVKAPTMVLHGANDTNVPVVEADQVVENLQRRGVPVEYVLFPDEGHGFSKEPNRIRAYVAVVSWFETHLKGGASP